MITWIQTVLQKHHKPVFIVLLIAIIIAFVFTIGSVPFLGDRNRAWDSHKDFYGFDLSNKAVVAQLQDCAFYEAMFNGSQNLSDEQFTQMVLRQACLLYVANQLGLRQVNQEEFVNYIHSAPVFKNPDGTFNKNLWDKFTASRVNSGRMTNSQLTYIIMQNALVSKVAKLLGGPGYISQGEIQRQYDQNYGSWDFNLAVLSYADFKPEIKPTKEQLETYFKANIESYRIGEGVVLETAFFPNTQYAANVKAPTEAEISTYFGTNISKYSTQKDGKPHTPQLSEVKSKVMADLLTEKAARSAASAAEEVAIKLYESQAKFATPDVKKVFADSKIQLKKSAPIRVTDKSAPVGIPTNVATAGLKLDENTFYSDPILSNDGVWLVVLSEKIPSYLPKFEDVKATVEENYVSAEKEKLFAQRGATLDAALVKAIADGKSFDSVAKEGGAKIEVIKDFSFANMASANQSIMQAYSVLATELPKLKIGGISKMVTAGQNGYIVNLTAFKKPTTEKSAEVMKTITDNTERMYGAVSANSVLEAMIQAQIGNLKMAE